MLELYYRYPKVLKWLRSGVLGSEMDRIAARLSEAGYKPSSAKVYLARIAQFEPISRSSRCSLENWRGGSPREQRKARSAGPIVINGGRCAGNSGNLYCRASG